MPLSRCRDVVARVSEIVDGKAGVVARARFFAHLAMCPECVVYYEQLRDLSKAAAAPQPEDLPADFDRVLGAVLAAIEDPAPSAPQEPDEA